MDNERKRLNGLIKIQGRTFHYVLIKEKNKTFVKIADIIFERNKNHNLLMDINKRLEEKGLIQAGIDAHDSI